MAILLAKFKDISHQEKEHNPHPLQHARSTRFFLGGSSGLSGISTHSSPLTWIYGRVSAKNWNQLRHVFFFEPPKLGYFLTPKKGLVGLFPNLFPIFFFFGLTTLW